MHILMVYLGHTSDTTHLQRHYHILVSALCSQPLRHLVYACPHQLLQHPYVHLFGCPAVVDVNLYTHARQGPDGGHSPRDMPVARQKPHKSGA
jgi:hypothetical protein